MNGACGTSSRMGIAAMLVGLVALMAGLLGGAVPVAMAAPTGNVVVDPTFRPLGAAGGRVYVSTAQSDGGVLIGGAFAIVGDQPRSNMARLNADGTLDASFTANANREVRAIAVQADGKVVIGGLFTEVNGVARRGVARLNSDGTLDASFNPGLGVTGDPAQDVRALVVQPDSAVVIGGRFSEVSGVPRGNIARLTATGAVDATFAAASGFNNAVNAVLRQPDGGFVVGGDFTLYSETARNGVARLLPTGVVDGNFNPGAGLQTWSSGEGLMTGAASALAMQPDGRLLVGGRFNRVNGFEMRSVTRLDPDGSRDASFVTGSGFQPEPPRKPPLVDIDAATVSALHVGSEGTVTVGGDFVTFNGTPRARLARLLASGTLDASFDPGLSIQSDHYLPPVDTLTGLGDGSVIVGGEFVRYDGDFHNAIVRVKPDGNADSDFKPVVGSVSGFDNTVTDVVVQPDGKIVAIGRFTAFNGTPRLGIARLNANGTLDTGFVPTLTPASTQGLVHNLVLQPDGRIIIDGIFNAVNGIARSGIARLNADGSLDTSFDPGAGFNVTQGAPGPLLVQPDGKIVVGGSFTSFNGVSASRIVRVNANGSVDGSFASGPGIVGPTGSAVSSLSLQVDGKIIAAGSFTAYGGLWPTPNLTRINPNGTLDPSLPGLPGPGAGHVSVGPDGSIVVHNNGVWLPRYAPLVKFRSNGSMDESFTSPVFTHGMLPHISTVVVLSDNSILVGGLFMNVAGVRRDGIARLLPSGALDPSFDPGSGIGGWTMEQQGVMSMAPMTDGRIVIGGGFSQFNGGFPSPANVTRLLPTVVPPGAPTGLSVTNGDGAALVSFTGPGSHGGAPVTNYEYSVDGGAWTARVPASAQPAVTVPGLANGFEVSVRVRAVNAAGPGPASNLATLKPIAAPATTFVSMPPARVIDTRTGGGSPIPSGNVRMMSVTTPVGGGAPVVPPGAVAVAYNLTVPSPAVSGHVRVMPGDAVGLPGASAINFRAGETIANSATVKIDRYGSVKVYNGAGAPVDVVIDVSGYFMPQAGGAAANAVAAANGVGGLFTAIAPVRVYDTVLDPAGPVPAGGSRLLSPRTAADGVTPVVPAGASAVAYNITVTDTVGAGHLRVFPTGAPLTATSVLNWSRSGERIANGAVVGVDDRGRFTVYNGGGAPVRFFVDVVGYYSATGAAFYPIDPVRTTETRYLFGGAGPIAPVAPGQRSVSTATSAAGGFPVVPAGATAAAYNATVVATGSSGHLRIYPTGAPLVGASALNWPGAGYTRANASIVGVSGNRVVTLYNGASTPTDVLIDVNGYYK